MTKLVRQIVSAYKDVEREVVKAARELLELDCLNESDRKELEDLCAGIEERHLIESMAGKTIH